MLINEGGGMLVIKIAFKALDDSGAKQEPNYTNTKIFIYKIAKNKWFHHTFKFD